MTCEGALRRPLVIVVATGGYRTRNVTARLREPR